MLFDKMAQIREIIGAICTIFNGHCPEEISPESFRQAKFDMNDTTPTLWRTLHTVLCINTFRPIDSSKHNLVNLCKHAMFQKGYKVTDFYNLPEDMSRGSRELMLALGWLMSKEDILSELISRLEPLIFEDPPIDLYSNDKIPLPKTLDHDRGCERKGPKNPAHVAELLKLKYHKLSLALRSLLASKREYTRAICKLHSVPKGAKFSSSSHFSSQDIYFLCHPQELLKYEERVGWFCNYAKALLLWVANEATFWKWMTSVLNAKMHDAKQTDRKADTSNCQEDQLLKPNRILQKTKEHQVELSQLLHLQETTYRTISKHWKKAKVVLQQSCVQNNDDLSKHLMLLDDELQLQMTELQEGSINECSKCWTQQTVPLCLRKLNQDQLRAGKASKEVSVVSQEIARLTKVKESLVYKLKTLQEKHKAKLYQVSHSHPNLICISSNMKGNGL